MLNHSRPNIRKRAILALYKTLVKYPEAIDQARVRLEEKLEDLDPCQCPFNLRGRSVLISVSSCRCSDSECTLRTCSAESQRLPFPCSAVFSSANILNKQLDAHQNYQAGKHLKSSLSRIDSYVNEQFGSLSPHEPRLVKKLQPPITELISTTPAISLLYECVHTCIIGGMLQGPSGDSLAKLCISKLAAFIQDADQNRGFRWSLFLVILDFFLSSS